MTTRQIFEMISDELRVKEEARARGREHGKNKWNVNAMAKNNSSSDENSSQEGEIRSKVIRQTATKDTARSGVTQADQNKNTGLKTEPECKPSQSPAQTRHQSTHIAPASAPLRSFSNPVWNRAPTVAWPTQRTIRPPSEWHRSSSIHRHSGIRNLAHRFPPLEKVRVKEKEKESVLPHPSKGIPVKGHPHQREAKETLQEILLAKGRD